ncbi:hypothetical protein NEOLEDRAFT_1130435 [Neolentinus lepideus HHB14362 ss-1]|uniref:Uncharacterized protein n=1 Tax=Neolentinus lepideus HHB14362 ss-1 TaxID=1314782 RepID=A0A165UBW9_9AGAM|nr:hypothetical protein NEOLEDRAFT_1130435 [Neolentinus lepideus HHB14362 ss-1]
MQDRSPRRLLLRLWGVPPILAGRAARVIKRALNSHLGTLARARSQSAGTAFPRASTCALPVLDFLWAPSRVRGVRCFYPRWHGTDGRTRHGSLPAFVCLLPIKFLPSEITRCSGFQKHSTFRDQQASIDRHLRFEYAWIQVTRRACVP